jgi:hypothetical protein
MPKAGGDFETAVLECVDDINGRLPELAARFDVLVVVSAFARHVGGALQLLMRRKMCDARQAQLVLRHIEEAAFYATPPPKAPRPTATPVRIRRE